LAVELPRTNFKTHSWWPLGFVDDQLRWPCDKLRALSLLQGYTAPTPSLALRHALIRRTLLAILSLLWFVEKAALKGSDLLPQ
jgi:hypothetical protein